MATNAIVKADPKLAATLTGFEKAASGLAVVKTGEHALAAKTLQKDIRDYLKDVHAKLDPFVNAAKKAYDDAKAERAKYLDPAEAIDQNLGDAVKRYAEQERLAAEQEQKREQERLRREAEERAEEQRKRDIAAAEEERKRREKELADKKRAGEITAKEAAAKAKEIKQDAEEQKQEAITNAEAVAANVPVVKVQPNIPKVQGVPTTVNWKFEVIDEKRIPRVYMKANLVDIGAMVRADKNKAKSEEKCPGIRVYND